MLKRIILLFFVLGLFSLSAESKGFSMSNAVDPCDTVNKFTYRIIGGGLMYTPAHSDPIPVFPLGYSFDFIQNDTRISSIMHNSQGFILRNQFNLNLKETPISPCVDIAYGLGNFNMIQYDELGQSISHSWFRKISLATVGAGVEVGGKYLDFGLKYRIGICRGGVNNDLLPFEPIVLNDGKLNLISNKYQGLDFSLGAKYKDFCLKFSRVYPITKPIYLSSGLFAGLFSTSLELGYTFKMN
jgi:hypothetical protein